MGRASSSKKVFRAARAAGKPGTSRNLLWPAVITVLAGVGVFLMVVSIPKDRVSAAPRIGDHWHAPYGVYLCGEFQPPLAASEDDSGSLHTHADGLVHIEPSSTAYTGPGANLGAFSEGVGLELDEDSLTLPGRETLENGDDCGGSPGTVQVKVWSGPDDTEGRVLEGDPKDYAFQDGDIVTIAFVAEGAEIPQPPSASTMPAAGGAPPEPPPADTPATSEGPAGSTGTTVAPDATATTVAPE